MARELKKIEPFPVLHRSDHRGFQRDITPDLENGRSRIGLPNGLGALRTAFTGSQPERKNHWSGSCYETHVKKPTPTLIFSLPAAAETGSAIVKGRYTTPLQFD
jgi:hypothetical protein